MGFVVKYSYYVYFFIIHFVMDLEFTYYIGYISFAILGYFNPLFSAMLLLDIFKRFPTARQIILAIEKPLDQIVITLIIYLMLTYFFALIVFFNLWDKYEYSG
jgi:hypothetical protein